MMENNAGRPVLPPGIRFAPTPEELIVDYLNVWVSDQKHAVPGDDPTRDPVTVCAADVYAEDPATLTAQYRAAGHDDGNWYFLCVNKWKDGNVRCGRFNRTVGGGEGGRWHGGAKRIAVGRHGYRLSFEHFDKDGDKTEWLMEEFGTALEAATSEQGVKVLCRVHRTPRADGHGVEGRKGAGRTLPASKRRRAGKQACQQQQGYSDARRQWQYWQQQQAMMAQGGAAAHDAAAGFSYDAGTSGVGTSYQWPQTTMTGEAAAAASYQQLPYTSSTSYTFYQCPQAMEQQGLMGYQLYNGAHGGGVHFQNEPEPLEVGYDNGCVDVVEDQPAPLEMVAADVEQQQCPEITGAVDVKDEPETLETHTGDMERQQWPEMGDVDVKDEAETFETHTGDVERQQWPEMGGVSGSRGVKDEPEALGMIPGGIDPQLLAEMGTCPEDLVSWTDDSLWSYDYGGYQPN